LTHTLVLGIDTHITADLLERGDVTLEESFLPLRGIDPVHRPARGRQPEREQVALGLHPRQHHPDLTKVDLSLRARGVLLRDEHLPPAPDLRVDLRPPNPDIVTDRRVRQLARAVFLS